VHGNEWQGGMGCIDSVAGPVTAAVFPPNRRVVSIDAALTTNSRLASLGSSFRRISPRPTLHQHCYHHRAPFTPKGFPSLLERCFFACSRRPLVLQQSTARPPKASPLHYTTAPGASASSTQAEA